MKILAIAALPVLLIVMVGCGQKPAVIRTKDADLAMYKRLVVEFCDRAKSTPAGAPAALEALLENLNESNKMELGGHKETIERLKVLCQDLTQMYGRSSGSAEISAKVDELVKIAQTLPGDLEDLDVKSSRPSDDI